MTLDPTSQEIARLKAQRAALTRAIDALEDLQRLTRVNYGVEVLDPTRLDMFNQPHPDQLRPAFHKAALPIETQNVIERVNQADVRMMHLPEAAKYIIQCAGRAMSNQEIAEVLQRVGYDSTSKNMPNNVGTALWRIIKDGDTEVTREGNVWKVERGQL